MADGRRPSASRGVGPPQGVLRAFRVGRVGLGEEMVAGGIGITLLPRIALDVECRAPSPVVIRPFRKPEPGRTIGLAWRPRSPREHEFRLLGELLARSVHRGFP